MIRLLSVLFLAMAAAANSYACSCAIPGESEQEKIGVAFAQAQNVFYANVISARVSGNGIEISVAPTEVFKGTVPLRMTTAADESACGIDVTVGRNYVFFVANDGAVGLCSGSRQRFGSPSVLDDRELTTILHALKRLNGAASR